jgi:hypothetical protein
VVTGNSATDAEGLTDGKVTNITGTCPVTAARRRWAAASGPFTPTDPNWFGTDSFEVTVTDDLGGTSTQVISVTLQRHDVPVVANLVPDQAATEDSAFSFSLPPPPLMTWTATA